MKIARWARGPGWYLVTVLLLSKSAILADLFSCGRHLWTYPPEVFMLLSSLAEVCRDGNRPRRASSGLFVVTSRFVEAVLGELCARCAHGEVAKGGINSYSNNYQDSILSCTGVGFEAALPQIGGTGLILYKI